MKHRVVKRDKSSNILLTCSVFLIPPLLVTCYEAMNESLVYAALA